MTLDKGLCGFRCVVDRVLVVTVRKMRMVCCRFVLPFFVMLCGFLVVPGRVFVMFGCLVMMLCCLFRHCSSSDRSRAKCDQIKPAQTQQSSL
jgi:hypothetical protein